MVEESMSNAGRTPPMQVFALSALQSCEFEDRGTKMNGWLFVAKCVMCLCIAAALKSCVPTMSSAKLPKHCE